MSLPDNGKNAILFCGQIRTGVDCHPNISKFLTTTEAFDIFIHTWDTNTVSHHGLYKRDEKLLKEKFKVEQQDINIIKEQYNPVDMQVSNFAEEFESSILYNNIPWLYSFIKVNQMRKRREQEQYGGLKYRRVLKMRFDVLFKPHHILEDEIKYMGSTDKLYTCDIWNALPCKVEDVLWMSSSSIMDIMEEWAAQRLQNSVITDRHLLDWQEDCALFLQDKNILAHGWQYNKVHVYRDIHKQSKIDINDFDAIEQLDKLR